MLEIELKAKVIDHSAVEKRLSAFMEFAGEIDKQDEYYALPVVTSFIPSIGFRLRLRSEPGRETVTFKEKTYTENIEINKEVEFGILDAEAFRKFLDKMSAKLLYKKRKTGTSWKGDKGIVAELVRVDGLGEFLEVETLNEEGSEIDVEGIKKNLFEVVQRCGLPLSSIEAKPYSQLLGMPRY
ncbi:MAG TPA: class IV adenylate cyclase [Rectinemataceae bacterium]|nr:class IV adenylate cyclase [Rectinemataceae bacterium]